MFSPPALYQPGRSQNKAPSDGHCLTLKQQRLLSVAPQQSMGSCEKMPKAGTSHACPRCDSGCLTVCCPQSNFGGRMRWHNNPVGTGVHPGTEECCCQSSCCVGHRAHELVVSQVGGLAAARCGQDRCPFPCPSHRHFVLLNSLIHDHVVFSSSLSSASNLVSALSTASRCWWIWGRKLSPSIQPAPGRDVPGMYPKCMVHNAVKNSEITIILPL